MFNINFSLGGFMKVLNIVKKNTVDFLEITIGSIITAIAINLFLVPYNIAPGGVSGIAIVLHYIFNLPVGAVMLALNIPLFVFGIKQLGGIFGIKTLYGTILLSIIIDLTSWIRFSTTDILLTTIFGGIMMGIGLGIVFRAGGTTGGTDLAAKILHSIFHSLTVGQFMFLVDTLVVILAIATFRSYELGLYAIISLFLSMKIIDFIIEGIHEKGAFIISNHAEQIAHKILTDMNRGVTALRGIGMYTKTEKNVLLVVVSRTEIIQLKQIVKDIDPNTFIILTDFKEVLGEGFEKKN